MLQLATASLGVVLLLTDAAWLARVGLGFIVLSWPLRLWRQGRLTVRTPLDGPWILFLLTAAMGVWAAYDRTLAWPRFRLILAGLGLYYALVNAPLARSHASLKAINRWCLGLCVFAAAVGTYFLLQRDWASEPVKIAAITRLGVWIGTHIPHISGEYFHGNSMGAVLTVAWPINVALVLGSCRPRVSGPGGHISRQPEGSDPCSAIGHHSLGLLLVSVCILVFLTFVLILTVSRGAWLALGTAVGVWLLSWLGRRWGPSSEVWAAGLVAGAVVISIGVLMLVWAGTRGALDSTVLARWMGSVPVGQTALSRLDLFDQGLTLARDYPLTGSGLGCFTMVHSTYALLVHVPFLIHAHNLFLDLTIEQGVLGLVAFVGAAAMVVVGLWRGRSRPPDTVWRTAAALSLAAVLVHGLLDDSLYGERLLPLVFVPFGLAMAASPQSLVLGCESGRRAVNRGLHTSKIRKRWVVTGLLLTVDIVAAAFVWRGPLLGLLFSNLGALHQTRAELSVYEWPAWPIQDAVRREVDLSRPVRELEQASAYDSSNATANRRLGMIKLSLGEYEGALGHLERAYAAELGSDTTRRLLGEALIVNGQLAAGRALWSTARNDQGQLEARVWWYEHIGDVERAAWIRQVVNGL